jgi:hypothetical protein
MSVPLPRTGRLTLRGLEPWCSLDTANVGVVLRVSTDPAG